MSGVDLEPLLAVVLWGGIYPGLRVALREVPVLQATAVRVAVAALVLIAAAACFARTPAARQPLRRVLAAGAAQACFQLLLVLSLRWTTAGQAAILLATSPLLTAIWFAARKGTRPTSRASAGLGIGFLGVGVLVAGAGGTAGAASSLVLGDLLALGAAAAWVWYAMAIEPLVASTGTIRATAAGMAVAACVIIPAALPGALAHVAWRAISWPAWAGLVYGATAGMVVAMALWGRAAHRLGPQRTMIYVYAEPVSAVVIAAIVLGETLTPFQMAGGMLALAGVWLASAEARLSRMTRDRRHPPENLPA